MHVNDGGDREVVEIEPRAGTGRANNLFILTAAFEALREHDLLALCEIGTTARLHQRFESMGRHGVYPTYTHLSLRNSRHEAARLMPSYRFAAMHAFFRQPRS